MRPQLLKETIKSHHAKGIPMLIEGEPGVGKSSVPRQVAKDLGIGCILFNVPLRMQEDYGMPVISADRSRIDFVVSDHIFPFVGSEKFPDEGILIADELSSAQVPEQKVWASIIHDRQLHERRIKPGWTIVATGNRTKDKAGANRILSMLADRMTRYTFEPHLDDWCSWALDAGVDPIVVSFLRFKPDLLSKFDPQQDCSPTPRSWAERVSPFLGDHPADAEFETYKGSVGDGAAAEFTAFHKMYLKLPNPDAILMDPQNAEVPTEPNVLFAISGAIANRATADNFERVMMFAKRLPSEFMVLVVRDAMRKDKSILSTRAFVDWTANEGAKILM